MTAPVAVRSTVWVMVTMVVEAPAKFGAGIDEPGRRSLVVTVFNTIRVLAIRAGARAGGAGDGTWGRTSTPVGDERDETMTTILRPGSTTTPGTWESTKVARWAGGLYIAYIVANVLASVIGHIGLSDSQTLARPITEDEPMFRVGLVAALPSGLLFVATAWALYLLLRPVDTAAALLLLVLNAVGVAIQCAGYLPLLAVLAQGAAHVPPGLTGAQLHDLAVLALSTLQVGFVTAQLYLSAWLLPLGWLVLRSGFLPRALGWLLLLDGVAVLAWFLQTLLAPAYPRCYPIWVIGQGSAVPRPTAGQASQERHPHQRRDRAERVARPRR